MYKSLLTSIHEILFEKLNYYEPRSKANNWVRSFLTNKKQYVSINSFFCQIKIVRCEVSQGTAFGPLLFLICINDLHGPVLGQFPDGHFPDGLFP